MPCSGGPGGCTPRCQLRVEDAHGPVQQHQVALMTQLALQQRGEARGIRHRDVDAIRAAGLQLLGAHLLQQAAVGEERVLGGQLLDARWWLDIITVTLGRLSFGGTRASRRCRWGRGLRQRRGSAPGQPKRAMGERQRCFMPIDRSLQRRSFACASCTVSSRRATASLPGTHGHAAHSEVLLHAEVRIEAGSLDDAADARAPVLQLAAPCAPNRRISPRWETPARTAA